MAPAALWLWAKFGTEGIVEVLVEELEACVAGVDVGVRETEGESDVDLGAGELPPLQPAMSAAISAIGTSNR